MKISKITSRVKDKKCDSFNLSVLRTVLIRLNRGRVKYLREIVNLDRFRSARLIRDRARGRRRIRSSGTIKTWRTTRHLGPRVRMTTCMRSLRRLLSTDYLTCSLKSRWSRTCTSAIVKCIAKWKSQRTKSPCSYLTSATTTTSSLTTATWPIRRSRR